MKRIILAILAATLFSSVCFAQTKRNQWDNLRVLKDGQKVEVEQSGSKLTATFKAVTDDDIIVEVKKQAMAIPRVDVRRVVLKKSKTGHVLLGASIGATVGAVIANTSSGDDVYSALAAWPIITGGGAAVGALLTSDSVVYERP